MEKPVSMASCCDRNHPLGNTEPKQPGWPYYRATALRTTEWRQPTLHLAFHPSLEPRKNRKKTNMKEEEEEDEERRRLLTLLIGSNAIVNSKY